MMTSRRYENGKLVERPAATNNEKPEWMTRRETQGDPDVVAINKRIIDLVPVEEVVEEPVVQSIAVQPYVAPVVVPAAVPESDEITDTNGLRKFLIQSMRDCARGKVSAEQVKSICALTQQIYQANRLEIEVAKLTDEQRKVLAAVKVG